VPSLRWAWLLTAALPLGCAGPPARIESRYPPQTARAVVFVVDGAGGYQLAPRSISCTVDELHLPLHVRSFDWTTGGKLGIADEVNQTHSQCESRRLAEEICAFRQLYPRLPIYLVAYSAGSTVALRAAEQLPSDSLERIVLLAPAVSAGYDLRPALACSRQGIDAFTSERDTFFLGVGTAVLGTSDGKRDDAAGRVGFRPQAVCPTDAALFAKLHQHPWDPCVAWTGNNGEHAATYQTRFFRAYVLPLLLPGK
jgi:pimeloyl-ACP methyl ester carboxylesterase